MLQDAKSLYTDPMWTKIVLKIGTSKWSNVVCERQYEENPEGFWFSE